MKRSIILKKFKQWFDWRLCNTVVNCQWLPAVWTRFRTSQPFDYTRLATDHTLATRWHYWVLNLYREFLAYNAGKNLTNLLGNWVDCFKIFLNFQQDITYINCSRKFGSWRWCFCRGDISITCIRWWRNITFSFIFSIFCRLKNGKQFLRTRF